MSRGKRAFESHAKQEVSSEMLHLQAVYDFVVETLKGLVPVSIANSQLKPITRGRPLVFTSLHLCLQQGLQFVHSKSTDRVRSEEGIIPLLLSPMPYNIK